MRGVPTENIRRRKGFEVWLCGKLFLMDANVILRGVVVLPTSYALTGPLIEALRIGSGRASGAGLLLVSAIAGECDRVLCRGDPGATAGSGSSKGKVFVLRGGVGTKLPYRAARSEGCAECLFMGMGIGGVFLCSSIGSSAESSESGRESAPKGAGEALRGSPGPSSCPPNPRSATGVLFLGLKGEVAPYKLWPRGARVGRTGVRGLAFSRFFARATALTYLFPAL